VTHDDAWLKSLIRDVPDFPQPGVVFKDITPLLADIDGLRYCVDALVDHFAGDDIDWVVGMEARGFIFGAPFAYRFGAGFVPIRKPGKLPHDTVGHEYDLEYGSDCLEVHSDVIGPGDRVVIIDDVLATGGTARATTRLIETLGGEVAGLGFVLELGFLGGADQIAPYPYTALLRYD
jgi:adenine phosphoribosyltransferase